MQLYEVPTLLLFLEGRRFTTPELYGEQPSFGSGRHPRLQKNTCINVLHYLGLISKAAVNKKHTKRLVAESFMETLWCFQTLIIDLFKGFKM